MLLLLNNPQSFWFSVAYDKMRETPVHMNKKPVGFRITAAYSEGLIKFRVHISISVPHAILSIPVMRNIKHEIRVVD